MTLTEMKVMTILNRKIETDLRNNVNVKKESCFNL